MARSEKDYGLPRLTVAEAARVLGVREGEFWLWLVETVRPSGSRLSKWRNDAEPLSEPLIRLYIAQHGLGFAASSPSPDGPAAAPPSALEEEGRRAKRRAS